MPSFSSAGAATGVGRCRLPALEFEEPLNFITCHRLSSPQPKEECFSEHCRRFMGGSAAEMPAETAGPAMPEVRQHTGGVKSCKL